MTNVCFKKKKKKMLLYLYSVVLISLKQYALFGESEGERGGGGIVFSFMLKSSFRGLASRDCRITSIMF